MPTPFPLEHPLRIERSIELTLPYHEARPAGQAACPKIRTMVAMVFLAVGETEEAFLELQVPAVPESEGGTGPLLFVGIFLPARPRPIGMLGRGPGRG
jgi:hypothetical protein